MTTELKVGDRIRDNDPRMASRNRVLTIVEIHPNGATAKDSLGRLFTYLRRSIHTDGKSRKAGFSLVKDDHV